MTAGVFVAVVGPSGAGKDTLMRAAQARLAGDPAFHFVRRLVTRPSSAHEDHDTLSQAEFDDGLLGGRFALAWKAHGLGYAVPQSAKAAVDAGRVAVCNLSRAAIPAASSAFRRQATILVTAPADVLLTRLAARRRETHEEIEARLRRESSGVPVVPHYTVVNDAAPEDGAARLVDILRRLQAEPVPLRQAG